MSIESNANWSQPREPSGLQNFLSSAWEPLESWQGPPGLPGTSTGNTTLSLINSLTQRERDRKAVEGDIFSHITRLNYRQRQRERVYLPAASFFTLTGFMASAVGVENKVKLT